MTAAEQTISILVLLALASLAFFLVRALESADDEPAGPVPAADQWQTGPGGNQYHWIAVTDPGDGATYRCVKFASGGGVWCKP